MSLRLSTRAPAWPLLQSLGLALCLAGVGAGCVSIRQRQSEAFDAFQAGHFDTAATVFEGPDETGSPFLSGVEAGTAALAAGDWERSITHFARAAEFVKELERTALINTQGLTESLLSLAFNDSVITYKGEGYERVMLHVSQAIAYLGVGQFQEARVELRLSDELLTSEQDLYEKEYAAGGLGHLLSAISYEMQGKLDEAYIDYRRMADKDLAPELVGSALVRIAEELNYPDADAWRERYGPAANVSDAVATVIVVAGVGLGPYKSETALSVPTEDGMFQFAVPEFIGRSQLASGVRLTVPTSDVAIDSVVIEDVTHVAQENLSDRIAWIAAKSVARGIGKRALTKELEDNHGLVGRIVGDLFTFVSERADLRSWMTLPDTWQACRLFLAPGEHELHLAALGGDSVALGRFALEPGETMFVFARTIDRRLYASVVGGLLIESMLEPSGYQEDPAALKSVPVDTGDSQDLGGEKPAEDPFWRWKDDEH